MQWENMKGTLIAFIKWCQANGVTFTWLGTTEPIDIATEFMEQDEDNYVYDDREDGA